MNQVLAFTHEKLKILCLKFDNVFKIPYVLISCVIDFRFDFRTYLKKTVHLVFSGFFGRFFVETASR